MLECQNIVHTMVAPREVYVYQLPKVRGYRSSNFPWRKQLRLEDWQDKSITEQTLGECPIDSVTLLMNTQH